MACFLSYMLSLARKLFTERAYVQAKTGVRIKASTQWWTPRNSLSTVVWLCAPPLELAFKRGVDDFLNRLLLPDAC
jgi:hypothetical protein